MLNAVELESFKAFGRRTKVPLAPITLIFGENSAGKSSILQSLSLLKQTREGREAGAILLPRAESGTVDLGSFQEMLFDHDFKRTLCIGMEMDLERVPTRLVRRPAQHAGQRIAYEMAVCRPSPTEEIRLRYLTVSFGEKLDPIARFEPIALTEQQRRLAYRGAFAFERHRTRFRGSDLVGAKCTWVTRNAKHWEDLYAVWRTRRQEICSILANYRKIRPEDSTLFPDEVSASPESRDTWVASISDAMSFYSSEFSLEAFIQRMRAAELETVMRLDGFIPVPIRGTRERYLPELRAIEYIRGRPDDFAPTLDVSALMYVAGRQVEDTLEQLFPLGPFRRPPERWYIYTGSSPSDVGYRGDLLPDLLFRRPELIEQANQWLHRLKVGYELDVKPIGGGGDLFEVRLIDRVRSAPVNVALTDVGFGISQLLPFVVQSLASEKQIISIEQPEVHVHPRLQADLGDLIAECIKTRHHQYIIETHSEHLILRMQRLVKAQAIKPEDLCIIHVTRGKDGAEVTRIRLGEEGEFKDEWPGGFFPERMRELF